MKIEKFKDLTVEAFKDIKKYQTGKRGVVKTGLPYFDDLFPVVNGSTIIFSAGSGIGKSYQLAKMIDNILDINKNPTADNFVVLNISLEMRVMSLVLRGMSKKIKTKSKKEILLEEFTEEEKAQANEYFKTLQDERVYISQVPTTPKKFYEGCKEFLEQHKNASSAIVTVDHLALISGDKGEPRNTIIENFIERVNDLKMEYENVIFILLSQTNSDMQKRAQDKNIMSQPTASDLYYSQFTFQVADYVAIMINPTKFGIQQYSKINPERYPHLEKYFLEEDKNGRVSLECYGVNYVHLLKCREAEGLYVDIYAEDLNIPNIDKVRNENKQASTVKTITLPVFEGFTSPLPTVKPLDAFGQSFEKVDNTPF